MALWSSGQGRDRGTALKSDMLRFSHLFPLCNRESAVGEVQEDSYEMAIDTLVHA